MKTPRRYAPMGGSFAPVRVAGFRWNGWQTSAVYAGGSRNRLDQHIEQLKTAIFAMAVKGNSQKNHGFAFLWKDYRPMSLAPYSITILNFAAFQSLERFFQGHDPDDIEISEMTNRFIGIVSDFGPIGHGESLEQIVNYGERYLKDICSPRAEGFMHWNNLKSSMLQSSDLIEFYSWGVFSELLADKLASKWKEGNHSIKLTDPNLGLELIDELVDDEYQFIDLSYYNYDPDDDL